MITVEKKKGEEEKCENLKKVYRVLSSYLSQILKLVN